MQAWLGQGHPKDEPRGECIRQAWPLKEGAELSKGGGRGQTRLGRKRGEIPFLTSWLGPANNILKIRKTIKKNTASYSCNNSQTIGIVHTLEVHRSKLNCCVVPGCSNWRILLPSSRFLMSDSFPTSLRILKRLRMEELSWHSIPLTPERENC